MDNNTELILLPEKIIKCYNCLAILPLRNDPEPDTWVIVNDNALPKNEKGFPELSIRDTRTNQGTFGK